MNNCDIKIIYCINSPKYLIFFFFYCYIVQSLSSEFSVRFSENVVDVFAGYIAARPSKWEKPEIRGPTRENSQKSGQTESFVEP